MSAMHWEARRRQQVLDRRLSASVKQVPMLTTVYEDKPGKNKEHSEAHMTPCEPAESSESPGKAAHNNRSTQQTSVHSRILH